MKTVFDSCEPRPEVLTGELKEETFAARLRDVIEGKADPVYQDPALFFENTYPTEGLRVLLNEALGRLTGIKPANNAIIRLETAFGGGKTHNLIALYHAARGHTPDLRFVDGGLIPTPGTVRVVGVVGSDLGQEGLLHNDGVTTYTLWGELAYQLGGPEGYALAAQGDRDRSAPGTGLLERLVGEEPTLIMLDEVARHLRVAKTLPTPTGRSTLAEQTVAFLMSLLEFAASRERVVVVLTLSDPSDAFGQESEDLRQELAEARRVTARQERVITPTGETEIPAIVTHRLFRQIDREAAREVADMYTRFYRRLVEQGVNLPQRALRAEYAKEMVTDYPFHPELLNTLTRKTATIPNFQKTRGALRLLAATIRRLWETRPADTYLIHPYHIDLEVDRILDDLTSRLDRPAFKQVVEADIVSPKVGAPAHAQVFDQEWSAAGKPPYTRRVATTVFLHSLTQGVASGVDPADLLLGVLAPGDDPALVHKAAERLYDKGWFFEWDGRRYRFKTEPSLNKIVADEMGMVGRTRAKAELDRRTRQIWKSGVFKVVPFPQEASDVDDDAGPPKLCILHYDAATATPADPAPPELARKIADYAGTQQAYRRFRNNVLFLVADADRVDEMVKTAQRYLAIARITGDTERTAEFTDEQQKKLKKMGEAEELNLRVVITRAYRHLYFPRADAPQKHSNLIHEILPAQDQGEVKQDQTAVVLRMLRQHQKALTGDDPTLAAAYVRSKAWDVNQKSMTTEELRQAFARRLGLPMLLDLNQLKKTVLNGIRSGVWIYYDATIGLGYDAESPPPAVRIDSDAHLYLPEEAARLDLPIKGKVKTDVIVGPEPTCPICGRPRSRCICAEEIEEPTPREPLRGEGVPQQALEQLLDRCHDRGVTHLASLRITVQGDDRTGAKDMRTLGLVVPQMGKGEFRIEQSYNAEFDDGQHISMRALLDWSLYKRLKQVTDGLAQEATKFTTRIVLTARFPNGLEIGGEQFETIRGALTMVGLGRITVEGEPFEGETE
ncbi:MAG TPA: ATP-binding protein [Anaerolineales bacterium]|nr:ATP-binding protein [Anaerolineales bacterium]